MFFDAVKMIMKTKKEKNMAKTLGILLISSMLFGISSILLLSKILFGIGTLMLGLAFFLFAIVFGLVLGASINISAVILGGKGKYFEGLASITYPLFCLSAGIFIISLLSFVPFTGAINIIILILAFAYSLSILYRGVKELFSLDMVTTFVVVSIQTLVIVIAIYSTMIMNMGRMIGGML